MGNRRTKERATAVYLDQPVNWDRLRRMIANQRHRGTPVLADLVPSGIVVEASSPCELVERTIEAIVDRTKNEPKN
jgi:hypothetical protein